MRAASLILISFTAAVIIAVAATTAIPKNAGAGIEMTCWNGGGDIIYRDIVEAANDEIIRVYGGSCMSTQMAEAKRVR